jgi:hypothetical protein
VFSKVSHGAAFAASRFISDLASVTRSGGAPVAQDVAAHAPATSTGMPAQPRSPFPSSSGSRAILMAIRRASSFVSTLACSASASLSRE